MTVDKISDMPQFEIEPDDEVLFGTWLATKIERFFPKLAKRMKDKGCGCSKREEYLNELHWKIRNIIRG